jgi:hypothetical protein
VAGPPSITAALARTGSDREGSFRRFHDPQGESDLSTITDIPRLRRHPQTGLYLTR